MGALELEHELVEDAGECDVAVINSCGVIEHTERKILKRVRIFKEMNKRVVMAGCLPAINPSAVEEAGVDEVVKRNPGSILSAVQGIEELNQDEVLHAPRKRGSAVVAIVPIAEGCLGKCSYCATRIARGRLESSPINFVVDEVRHVLEQGFKEIQLTAQDTAIYGRDRGTSLPELLMKIRDIPSPSKFRVRVGMMNPKFAIEVLDDLCDAYDHENIYKFLHLPVQSGDDAVLEHMKRGYSVQDFIEIVNAFRRRFPELMLATDVIVGYPTEDEESFLMTYKLIEDVRPDVLNITRFSSRPGTLASKLKDMPDRYKKERSRKLTSLQTDIGLRINERLVGKELEVLITEKGKNGTMKGRTNFYKTVVLESGNLGEFMTVRIKGATFSYLIAEA